MGKSDYISDSECKVCGASAYSSWGNEGFCSQSCQRKYYKERYGIDLDAKDRGESPYVNTEKKYIVIKNTNRDKFATEVYRYFDLGYEDEGDVIETKLSSGIIEYSQTMVKEIPIVVPKQTKARTKYSAPNPKQYKNQAHATKQKSSQEQSKDSVKPTPAKILVSGALLISTGLLVFWVEEGWISLFGLFAAILFLCFLIVFFKKPKAQ